MLTVALVPIVRLVRNIPRYKPEKNVVSHKAEHFPGYLQRRQTNSCADLVANQGLGTGHKVSGRGGEGIF